MCSQTDIQSTSQGLVVDFYSNRQYDLDTDVYFNCYFTLGVSDLLFLVPT